MAFHNCLWSPEGKASQLNSTKKRPSILMKGRWGWSLLSGRFRRRHLGFDSCYDDRKDGPPALRGFLHFRVGRIPFAFGDDLLKIRKDDLPILEGDLVRNRPSELHRQGLFRNFDSEQTGHLDVLFGQDDSTFDLLYQLRLCLQNLFLLHVRLPSQKMCFGFGPRPPLGPTLYYSKLHAKLFFFNVFGYLSRIGELLSPLIPPFHGLIPP